MYFSFLGFLFMLITLDILHSSGDADCKPAATAH